jgi:GNAT superfamily N-acetyltransferase
MRTGTAAAGSGWRVTANEQAPDAVDRLLHFLPSWFGIESSIVEYVEAARQLPTYLAWPSSGAPASGAAAGDATLRPAGVLLAARHFPGAAEIHLIAVEPSLHRHGVGRALVEALEVDLIADQVSLLQVKTLGPSHPDAGYRETRRFYQRMGFQPLEEIHGLWPENPCLIMIKVIHAVMAGPGGSAEWR